MKLTLHNDCKICLIFKIFLFVGLKSRTKSHFVKFIINLYVILYFKF